MHSGFQARHIFRSSQMSVVAKLSWKLSTNGKSCPLVSPGMSTIYSDLFKTYLLCPHFLISSHSYQSALFGWKTNYPNNVLLPCQEHTKKKKNSSLNPEGRQQTLAGRQVSKYQHTALCGAGFLGWQSIYFDAFHTTHVFSIHHCQSEAAQHNSKISCSA